MPTETAKGPRRDRVVQFSVFTPNRLGRLHDLIGMLTAHSVHVLGLMVLDTTDSAIIRLVVDDPEQARDLLARQEFPLTESPVLVVEATPAELGQLMAVLLQAELNINYLYCFLPHPNGKSLIALSMEDNEVAEHALRLNQFTICRQADISR